MVKGAARIVGEKVWELLLGRAHTLLGVFFPHPAATPETPSRCCRQRSFVPGDSASTGSFTANTTHSCGGSRGTRRHADSRERKRTVPTRTHGTESTACEATRAGRKSSAGARRRQRRGSAHVGGRDAPEPERPPVGIGVAWKEVRPPVVVLQRLPPLPHGPILQGDGSLRDTGTRRVASGRRESWRRRGVSGGEERGEKGKERSVSGAAVANYHAPRGRSRRR